MRKTNEIRRFARWCFSRLGMRPIRIHYINAPCLVDQRGEHCFGCYSYGYDDTPIEEGQIFLACKLPKFAVLSVLAHEIWHHYQNVHGTIRTLSLEDCEKQAERAGGELLALWLIRGGYVKKENGDDFRESDIQSW